MAGETKWTKGPWDIVDDGDDDVSVCAFEGDPRDGIMADVICEVTSIKAEQDAHLIAAAPALYEALEALAAECQNEVVASRYMVPSQALTEAFAALAQARGEG